MMQPFFIRTRATMMSRPTTNCRCSSGFSSSRSMVCQGTCRNSILLARFFVAVLRLALFRPALLRFAILDLRLRRLAAGFAFAFAMSVHLSLVNFNGIIVQVTVSQLQSLRLVDFSFRNHLGQRRCQSAARRLHSQPAAFFRAQSLVVRE